jgi:hypothetical protein
MADVGNIPPELPPPADEAAEAQDGITNTDTAVTTTNPEKKVKKIKKVKKRRPARPQVDPATFKSEPPPQTGTIFNIVYKSHILTPLYLVVLTSSAVVQ